MSEAGPEGCAFCAIVAGREDAAIVLEDDLTVAFLDRRPLFGGHTLLVPRQHLETLAELPSDVLTRTFVNVQLLSGAVPRAMGAEGSFVAMNNVVSQSVPHFHVHVVPRRRKDGLRGFFWPRNEYESESDLAAARDAIRLAIDEERAR